MKEPCQLWKLYLLLYQEWTKPAVFEQVLNCLGQNLTLAIHMLQFQGLSITFLILEQNSREKAELMSMYPWKKNIFFPFSFSVFWKVHFSHSLLLITSAICLILQFLTCSELPEGKRFLIFISVSPVLGHVDHFLSNLGWENIININEWLTSFPHQFLPVIATLPSFGQLNSLFWFARWRNDEADHEKSKGKNLESWDSTSWAYLCRR